MWHATHPGVPEGRTVRRGFGFLARGQMQMWSKWTPLFHYRRWKVTHSRKLFHFWLLQNSKLTHHNTVSATSLLFRKLTAVTMLNSIRARAQSVITTFCSHPCLSGMFGGIREVKGNFWIQYNLEKQNSLLSTNCCFRFFVSLFFFLNSTVQRRK